MTGSLHRIELRYIDTCTIDYVTDLTTGVLFGVHVDNASTWADAKQDLLHQLDHSEGIPDEDFDLCKAAIIRWFDRMCKPNASEETLCAKDVGYSFDDPANTWEPISMWFRLTGVKYAA